LEDVVEDGLSVVVVSTSVVVGGHYITRYKYLGYITLLDTNIWVIGNSVGHRD